MFKVGDKVGIVKVYHFFENIKRGDYAIGTIVEVSEHRTSDGNGYYYRATDGKGGVYGAYSIGVSSSPTEFVSLDYLRDILKRLGNEALSDGYALLLKAESVQKVIEEEEKKK